MINISIINKQVSGFLVWDWINEDSNSNVTGICLTDILCAIWRWFLDCTLWGNQFDKGWSCMFVYVHVDLGHAFWIGLTLTAGLAWASLSSTVFFILKTENLDALKYYFVLYVRNMSDRKGICAISTIMIVCRGSKLSALGFGFLNITV